MIRVPSGNPPSRRRLSPTIPVVRFLYLPPAGMSKMRLVVSIGDAPESIIEYLLKKFVGSRAILSQNIPLFRIRSPFRRTFAGGPCAAASSHGRGAANQRE